MAELNMDIIFIGLPCLCVVYMSGTVMWGVITLDCEQGHGRKCHVESYAKNQATIG